MNLNDLKRIFIGLRTHCDVNENILNKEHMCVKPLLNSENFLNKEEICSLFYVSKYISIQDACKLTSKSKCVHSYKDLWSNGYFPNQLKESIIFHILKYECGETCPYDIFCDTSYTVFRKDEINKMKHNMKIAWLFE